MTEAQCRQLHKSWLDLIKLKHSMGQKVLELIAHPDCKPEDIAAVMPRYQAVVEMLRSHKPVLIEAFEKGRYYRYAAELRSQRIV